MKSDNTICMALIKCSDCGKEVSSRARACPQCGRPLGAAPASAAAPEAAPPTETPATCVKGHHGLGTRNLVILIGVVVLVVAGLAIPKTLRGSLENQSNTCTTNMFKLYSAGQTWGLETGRMPNGIPQNEIVAYIQDGKVPLIQDGKVPICPGGGQYTFDGWLPCCTKHGSYQPPHGL